MHMPLLFELSIDMLHDIARNRESDTLAAARLCVDERVDANQAPLGIEHWSARITGIDRGIGLQAVRVLKKSAGRVLVSMHSRKNAVRDRGLEIVG